MSKITFSIEASNWFEEARRNMETPEAQAEFARMRAEMENDPWFEEARRNMETPEAQAEFARMRAEMETPDRVTISISMER